MLINREVILAKTEVTYGTDSVPVEGTDAMLVENINWSNESLRFNERPAVRASLGQLQGVYGGALRSVQFDVEMKGSGIDPSSTATPPEFAPLLRACAMTEDIIPSTSVGYQPESDPALHESITIYYFQDGIRYDLLGCRGNVSFNFETGAIPKMSFSFTGHLVGPADIALASPTVLAVVPVSLINVPFTIGGFAALINAVTTDLSNTLAMPPDMAATDGFGEVQVTERDVNGSYDPEAELLAVENPHTDFVNGIAQAVSIGPIGSVAGNIIDVDYPAAYYRDIAPGDRDGIRTYDIPFGAAEVSPPDDEIVIIFT